MLFPPEPQVLAVVLRTTTERSTAQEEMLKDVSTVVEAVLIVGTESCLHFTAAGLKTNNDMEKAKLDYDSLEISSRNGSRNGFTEECFLVALGFEFVMLLDPLGIGLSEV